MLTKQVPHPIVNILLKNEILVSKTLLVKYFGRHSVWSRRLRTLADIYAPISGASS